MGMTDDQFVRHAQLTMKRLGLFDATVGGTAGPVTLAAFERLVTLASKHIAAPPEAVAMPPWMQVGLETLGWHETTHNKELRTFLKRDGLTLGDPRSLPWCGDFVETCLKIALPKEPMPGDLGKNPYWALNWLGYGRKLAKPMKYAPTVFDRPGAGAHVCFVIAQDATHYHAFGGNQSNAVSVTRIVKGRLLGSMWPTTYGAAPEDLPTADAGNLPTSANEF